MQFVNATESTNFCVAQGKVYGNHRWLEYYGADYTEDSVYAATKVYDARNYRAEELQQCYVTGHVGDINYLTEYYNFYWSNEEQKSNFTASPMTGYAPLTVTFTPVDMFLIRGTQWNFGDGNITNIIFPYGSPKWPPVTHTYNNTGLYTVIFRYSTPSDEFATVSQTINVTTPQFYYPNVTIDVFSTTTGMSVPRAAVNLSGFDQNGAWTDHSYTDIYGTYTLNLVAGFIDNAPANATISKVGYNTTTINFNVTSNADINLDVFLNDSVWNQSGSNAIVYLDVAEEANNSTPIFGATIGIKNTTSDVSPWWYSTYPDSTILFTTIDGTINLSLGQTIEFAGYKTGNYSAGHTDPITLTSPVSRITLLLTKSDVIPVNTINGSPYYPVTIMDAVTGNAISGSWLNVDGSLDFTGWYNRSSATGKFNITGKGTSGLVPLFAGDVLTLEGNATGYVNNGFALLVANSTSGVLQTINLLPIGDAPISGEFTAIVNVYASGSTAAISGASVNVQKGNYSVTKSTLSSGVATFKNLTSGDSYSLTVSKSGYTTVTKTFTGGSGNVISLDIPMTSVSVNPTSTSTITPIPTVTITNIPTTSSTTGGYTGFWGPFYDFFSAMGAVPSQLNLMMAGLFIFAGVVCGGFGAGTIFPGANGLNVSGALVGGVMGFMAATVFGFINVLYLIVLVIFGIFLYFFTR